MSSGTTLMVSQVIFAMIAGMCGMKSATRVESSSLADFVFIVRMPEDHLYPVHEFYKALRVSTGPCSTIRVEIGRVLRDPARMATFVYRSDRNSERY